MKLKINSLCVIMFSYKKHCVCNCVFIYESFCV